MHRKLTILLTWILLLSTSGVYATWRFAELKPAEKSVNVYVSLNEFVYPLFTVTYMVGEDVYLKEGHFDELKDYTVIGAPNGNANFKQWVNANGVAVTSIPKDNKNDYIL